jgi:hypothetical protein
MELEKFQKEIEEYKPETIENAQLLLDWIVKQNFPAYKTKSFQNTPTGVKLNTDSSVAPTIKTENGNALFAQLANLFQTAAAGTSTNSTENLKYETI